MRILPFALAFFLWTAPALACSLLQPCPHAVPAPATTVPANAPAYRIEPKQGSLSGITLTGPGGQAVPFLTVDTPEGFDLVPKIAGQPGEDRTLAFAGGCAEGSEPSTFHLGPAAPLPTTVGMLTEAAHARATIDVATSAGSCTVEIQADVVTLHLQPAALLVPWLPLARLRVEVDGAPWSRVPSGGLAADGTVTPAPGLGLPPLRLHAACEPVPTGGDAGLTVGTHQVQVFATLAGVKDEVSSGTAVVLSCGQGTGADTSGDGLSAGDAAVTDTTPAPGGLRSGCTAGTHGSLLYVLGILVWLGAWLGVRRRGGKAVRSRRAG